MSIKIQTKQTFIPIEIGDELTLKFDLSDEAMLNLKKKVTDVQKSFAEVDENDSDEEAIEKVKNIIRTAFDEIFGEGTFDKVYAISPSTLIVAEYFMQIAQGLQEEMRDRGFITSPQDKVEKYLQYKSEKNQRKSKK